MFTRLPFWKNIVFSAVAVVGFFLLLELVLHLVPLPFHNQAVREAGRRGGKIVYEITYGREISGPKARGVFRIVVLGSSAALGTPFSNAGFPEQLKAILDLANPEARFEVINLATEGMNSSMGVEFTRQVFLLEPDLILVYLGDNEQLAYSSINSYSHPLLARIETYLLLHSRLVGAFLALQGEIFYRGKIQKMVGKYFHSDGRGPRRWPLARKDECRRAWLFNLEQMAKLAQKQKVRMVISTLGANRSQWPPIRSVHSPNVEEKVAQELKEKLKEIWGLIQKDDWEQARSEAAETISRDPEYALSWFYLGLVELKQQEARAAKESFEKAIELSDFQQETSWKDNEILLQTCREKKLVCLDLNSRLDRISPNGFAGFNLFMDYCHYDLEGSYQAALFFYQSLAELGLLPIKPANTAPEFKAVMERLHLPSLSEEIVYYNYGILLSDLFSRRELFTQAVLFLEQAAQTESFLVPARLNQTLIWLRQGDIKNAEIALTRLRVSLLRNKSTPLSTAPVRHSLFFFEDDYAAVKLRGVDWPALYFFSGGYSPKLPATKFSEADHFFQWSQEKLAYVDKTREFSAVLSPISSAPASRLFLWPADGDHLRMISDLKTSAKPGAFTVTGKKPLMVFDLPETNAARVKNLTIKPPILDPSGSKPELYWRAPNEEFSEAKKLAFDCSRDICRIALYDHPRWLFSGPVAEIRVQFPPGVKSFKLKIINLEFIPN